MNPSDLYLNEDACTILLNIKGLIPIINTLTLYDDVKELDMETYISNNIEDKVSNKYTIKYYNNSNILINSSDGRELIITIPSSTTIRIAYKLNEDEYITYNYQTNTPGRPIHNIKDNEISIVNINYRQYQFEKSLLPLHILEGINHNKYIKYEGLAIDCYTLEPYIYDGRNKLPKLEEIKSFSAQQEKIKLSKIIGNSNCDLNTTTKNLIKDLDEKLNAMESKYKLIIDKHNEWLKKLEEHKQLVNNLSQKVFTNDELNNLTCYIEESLSNENAKSLLKTLSPNMIEAIKRQLKK